MGQTATCKPALRAEAIVSAPRPQPHRLSPLLGQPGLDAHEQLLPELRARSRRCRDWFEHWATKGVKPLFTCEYGVPCTWDWTMYRGWYKGQREFGSAAVPWEFCVAEWNAQFLGDRAYQISEAEKANLRWEAKQFRAGELLAPLGLSPPGRLARFRGTLARVSPCTSPTTGGPSAPGACRPTRPGSHEHFWTLRDGVDKGRKELKVDWENLQRPGFSPDYIEQPLRDGWTWPIERSDWIPTAAGAGAAAQQHAAAGLHRRQAGGLHQQGPQLPVRARRSRSSSSSSTTPARRCTADCEWSLGLPHGRRRHAQRSCADGPAGAHSAAIRRCRTTGARRSYELSADGRSSAPARRRRTRSRSTCCRARRSAASAAKIALFDPKGETRQAAGRTGRPVRSRSMADADLAAYDVLVVGKGALTVDGPAPDVSRVRDGLKVIVFEQTPEVLEKRFGFRVAEYGLRQVFPARARSSAAGRARRGEPCATGAARRRSCRRGWSTLLSPTFSDAPTVQWCDIEVPRVWRCGNRGNVASVLIEKPARGDFLPILDGGYSLQYSPLMEYREGKGMVLFCQMDVTGRTESDPAAETLARNILRLCLPWKPARGARPSTSAIRPGRTIWSRRASPWLPIRVASRLSTRSSSWDRRWTETGRTCRGHS